MDLFWDIEIKMSGSEYERYEKTDAKFQILNKKIQTQRKEHASWLNQTVSKED